MRLEDRITELEAKVKRQLYDEIIPLKAERQNQDEAITFIRGERDRLLIQNQGLEAERDSHAIANVNANCTITELKAENKSCLQDIKVLMNEIATLTAQLEAVYEIAKQQRWDGAKIIRELLDEHD